MEDLLRRTLGEGVDLTVKTTPQLWPAHCDANQLESALLNLAINARDAMPGGGKLDDRMRQSSLDRPRDCQRSHHARRLRVVSIADTGVGMPDNVKAEAFDPFFTTKPIGKGTGLGLSMVYGFVRQSGGYVEIHSKPGLGTTVKLYLPRLTRSAPIIVAPEGAKRSERAAGESVLVVEDDAHVKIMIGAVLADFGYQVTEAANADVALEILRGGDLFHLLITDVGLPGTNGRQLAEMARRLRPELPVLFVTGYTGAAAVRSEFLDPGMHMISKPFSVQTLAGAVRDALEA